MFLPHLVLNTNKVKLLLISIQKIHYNIDSLWTMKNIEWHEEKIQDKVWMINVTNFEVPITTNNQAVKNATVQNSRINRIFKSWRSVRTNNIPRRRGGGLLLKWGKK